MAQETNQTQVPMLCPTGCGFYGNPRTNGMCSICYKDFLQRQNSSGRGSPPAGIGGISESPESSSVQAPSVLSLTTAQLEQNSQSPLSRTSLALSEEFRAAGDTASVKTEELLATATDPSAAVSVGEKSEKAKPRKNRCFMCRKKVGLTGFDCRCGNLFCGIHRYSDIHSCTFDYKADAAEKIRKENPVVVGEKIQKI